MITEGEEKKARLLIDAIKVGQEGSVKPDNGSIRGNSGSCNSTGVVRDALYAKKYLDAMWRELAEVLKFDSKVVQDLDIRNEKHWD